MFFKSQPTVDQLCDRELALIQRRDEMTAALAEAEADATRRLVEGDDLSSAGPDLARLTSEIRSLSLAAVAIRNQRRVAILGEWEAEAKKLRSEADEKARELEALEKATGNALAALSELEGVPYTSAVLSLQVAPEGLRYAVPKSQKLKDEIQRLGEQADELEARKVPQHGIFDQEGLTSRRELLQKLLRVRADVPTLDAVQSWLDECELAAGSRDIGELPRRVRLIWKAGVIDPVASYVYVPAFATPPKPASSPDGWATGFDIAAGTLRSKTSDRGAGLLSA